MISFLHFVMIMVNDNREKKIKESFFFFFSFIEEKTVVKYKHKCDHKRFSKLSKINLTEIIKTFVTHKMG